MMITTTSKELNVAEQSNKNVKLMLEFIRSFSGLLRVAIDRCASLLRAWGAWGVFYVRRHALQLATS